MWEMLEVSTSISLLTGRPHPLGSILGVVPRYPGLLAQRTGSDGGRACTSIERRLARDETENHSHAPGVILAQHLVVVKTRLYSFRSSHLSCLAARFAS